jgi:branched-chain amino acid transport system substrate-binding protein
MYTEFDNKGDLDRMSFMVQVKNGKQTVVDFVPPLPKDKGIAAAPAPAVAPSAPKAGGKPAAKP